MTNELWNTATGNLIDEYPTLDEALVTVQELLELEGAEVIDDLVLRVWRTGADAPAFTFHDAALRRLVPGTRTVRMQLTATRRPYESRPVSPTRTWTIPIPA
jgi:hypothetical protein